MVKSPQEQQTYDDIIPQGLSLDPQLLADELRHVLMSSFIINFPSGRWDRGCRLKSRFEFSPVSEERSEQAFCMHFELRVNVGSEGEEKDVQRFSVNLAVVDKDYVT